MNMETRKIVVLFLAMDSIIYLCHRKLIYSY